MAEGIFITLSFQENEYEIYLNKNCTIEDLQKYLDKYKNRFPNREKRIIKKGEKIVLEDYPVQNGDIFNLEISVSKEEINNIAFYMNQDMIKRFVSNLSKSNLNFLRDIINLETPSTSNEFEWIFNSQVEKFLAEVHKDNPKSSIKEGVNMKYKVFEDENLLPYIEKERKNFNNLDFEKMLPDLKVLEQIIADRKLKKTKKLIPNPERTTRNTFSFLLNEVFKDTGAIKKEDYKSRYYPGRDFDVAIMLNSHMTSYIEIKAYGILDKKRKYKDNEDYGFYDQQAKTGFGELIDWVRRTPQESIQIYCALTDFKHVVIVKFAKGKFIRADVSERLELYNIENVEKYKKYIPSGFIVLRAMLMYLVDYFTKIKAQAKFSNWNFNSKSDFSTELYLNIKSKLTGAHCSFVVKGLIRKSKKSVVLFGTPISRRKLVVIKIYFGLQEIAEREVKHLKILENVKGVQKIIEFGIIKNHFPVIVTYPVGIPIQNIILKKYENLSLIKELSIILESIHKKGIVHGDIKPDNIILVSKKNNSPNKLHPILIDFGSSYSINEKFSCAGTNKYASLDSMLRKKPSPLQDYHSLMYTAMALANCDLPWSEQDNFDCIVKLKQSFNENIETSNLPIELKKLANTVFRENFALY